MVGIASMADLILYAITVGKLQLAVQAPYYTYRRENYKHNSNFIPKTVANLIEAKLRCGLYEWLGILHEQAGHPWIHRWPRTLLSFISLIWCGRGKDMEVEVWFVSAYGCNSLRVDNRRRHTTTLFDDGVVGRMALSMSRATRGGKIYTPREQCEVTCLYNQYYVE